MNFKLLTVSGIAAILIAAAGCSTETPPPRPPSKEYIEGQTKAQEDMQAQPRDWQKGYVEAVKQRDEQEAEALRRKQIEEDEEEERRMKKIRDRNAEEDVHAKPQSREREDRRSSDNKRTNRDKKK